MKHDIEGDYFPIVLDLDSRQNSPPALLGGMLNPQSVSASLARSSKE
jgi:hypothetical protein